MRDLRPFPGAVILAAAVACGCGPTSFPDTDAVAAAQGAWCQALAKANGAGAGWEHLGACKGATPTGSASYLRGMTTCFPAHKEAKGENRGDVGLLVAECRDEVLIKMTIDEAVAAEAVAARCERAGRCEKTEMAECLASAKKVDPTQRATLYGIYNGKALHQISDCLKSSSCREDEYAAQQACYKSVEDKLVWLP
jgi:hypothetical protein